MPEASITNKPHPLSIERRSHPRYPISALVDYSWPSDGKIAHSTGYSRDISRRGLCVRSEQKPPINTALEVTVRFREKLIPRAMLQLHLCATVLRTETFGFVMLIRDYEMQHADDVAAVAEALVGQR